MGRKLQLIVFALVALAEINGGQVVFDDEPPPQRGPQQPQQFQQQNDGTGGRGFGFGFGTNGFTIGFGNNGNNGEFGGNNFNNGGKNIPESPPPPPSGGGFGNGNNFGGGNKNIPESAPQGDCQTFQNDEGFCTPLTSCRRISRMLRNRNPLAAARLLRRSICGISGIVPSVCCPLRRHGQDFPDNSVEDLPPVPVTPLPTTQRPRTLPPQTTPVFIPPPPTTTRNPFGGGGITLIPPKTTTTGGGGGLIIISPTKASTPDSPGLSDIGLPPPSQCGFSNASHTRIVGGKVAPKGAWPWIAALGYRDDTTGEVNYLCGGALISKDWVVTASHCVYKRNDLVTIRLGDHDLFTDGDGLVPLNVGVQEILLHPKYDPAIFYNDIALIRLRQSVPFSAQVHPICLPSSSSLRSNLFQDNTPFVAGWGAIQFNGPSSSTLREVQVPIVLDSVCQEKFKSFKSVNVDDTNICAGLAAGGKDACQGDSGGPLMQPVGSNRYVLIGVVSFGFKCAEPGYPGVYSRITSHLPWIEKTIN